MRADLAALRAALPVPLRGGARAAGGAAGEVRFHLAGAGAEGAQAPAFLRRIFERARPALAQAAAALYRNDTTPLETKLATAVSLARSGLGWQGMISLGREAAQLWLAARSAGQEEPAPAPQPASPSILQPIEQKLSAIEYFPAERSHIRF